MRVDGVFEANGWRVSWAAVRNGDKLIVTVRDDHHQLLEREYLGADTWVHIGDAIDAGIELCRNEAETRQVRRYDLKRKTTSQTEVIKQRKPVRPGYQQPQDIEYEPADLDT